MKKALKARRRRGRCSPSAHGAPRDAVHDVLDAGDDVHAAVPRAAPHVRHATSPRRALLQNDYGLTIGVLPFDKLQAEIGVRPSSTRASDGRLRAAERQDRRSPEKPRSAAGRPALSVGISNVGLQEGRLRLQPPPRRARQDHARRHRRRRRLLRRRRRAPLDGQRTARSAPASWRAATTPDIELDLPGLEKITLRGRRRRPARTGSARWARGVGLYFTPVSTSSPARCSSSTRTSYDATYGIRLHVDGPARRGHRRSSSSRNAVALRGWAGAPGVGAAPRRPRRLGGATARRGAKRQAPAARGEPAEPRAEKPASTARSSARAPA